MGVEGGRGRGGGGRDGQRQVRTVWAKSKGPYLLYSRITMGVVDLEVGTMACDSVTSLYIVFVLGAEFLFFIFITD